MSEPNRFRVAEVRLQLGLVNEAIDEYETLVSDQNPAVRQRAGFALGKIYRSYAMDDAAETCSLTPSSCITGPSSVMRTRSSTCPEEARTSMIWSRPAEDTARVRP